MGLLSEAGCPAIADPGAALIEAAHREGFRVVPLVGPSSIVLALMAPGWKASASPSAATCRDEANASEKADPRARAALAAGKANRRSSSRRRIAMRCCSPRCSRPADPRTRLCIAADLTLPPEAITTQTMAEWRRAKAAIGRRPAVFLLLSGLRRAAATRRKRCSRAGAEAPGELLGDGLRVTREVDDVLGLDDLARDVLEAADAVGEAELDAALAGPDQAAEDLGRSPSAACRGLPSPRR